MKKVLIGTLIGIISAISACIPPSAVLMNKGISEDNPENLSGVTNI
jgi:hypothetical protein